MADSTLNRFLAGDTAAVRAGFTPSAPSPATGPKSGYIFFEDDTGKLWAYNKTAGLWVPVGGAAGSPTGVAPAFSIEDTSPEEAWPVGLTTLSPSSGGGGGGTPGGSNTQVQYNASGSFGGIADGTQGQVLTSQGASATPAMQFNNASYTVPTLASFTWANQASATVTQTVSGQAILMTVPEEGSTSWQLQYLAPPATPYKLRAQIELITNNSRNPILGGIAFYDGTKALLFGSADNGWGSGTLMYVGYIPTLTSSDTALLAGWQGISNSEAIFTGAKWLQIRDDATNLFFDISFDGQNFINLYSEAVGTHLTPTQIGFWGRCNTGTGADTLWVSLKNWFTYTNATLD